jgi:triple functional domain protein
MRPISSLPGTEENAANKTDETDWNGSLPASAEGPSEPDSLIMLDSVSDSDKVELDKVDEHTDGDPVVKAVEQRQYRLTELLESEKMYVADLEQCAAYINYMRASKEDEEADIKMPEDLREGKDRMVFGNLENIYKWHKDVFLKNLEKCIENPVDLGKLFKRYEVKFRMYVVYCQNKPKSEYIVSEHIDTYFEEIRLKHGFKLRLTDLLIKPIQRLTKYHMLLEAILKHSQRAGLTDEAVAIGHALHVMTVVPNQANDMMDIGRLQGFDEKTMGKIVAQGNLLLRGPLQCTDDPTTGPNFKLKEMTVFLFEQIMIFAETVGKKTQFTSPNYYYKNHIQVNKMTLEEKVEGGDALMFKIKSTDPNRSNIIYICLAPDQQTRERWKGCIRRQLQVQQDFLRALQDPVGYHNKIGKEL